MFIKRLQNISVDNLSHPLTRVNESIESKHFVYYMLDVLEDDSQHLACVWG